MDVPYFEMNNLAAKFCVVGLHDAEPFKCLGFCVHVKMVCVIEFVLLVGPKRYRFPL